jgi:hypothetical protein
VGASPGLGLLDGPGMPKEYSRWAASANSPTSCRRAIGPDVGPHIRHVLRREGRSLAADVAVGGEP